MQIEIYSTTLPASLATMFNNATIVFVDARTAEGRTIDREIIEDASDPQHIAKRMKADHDATQIVDHGAVDYVKFRFLASR
jgi:F420-0:gamma-glutamyl ligase